MTADALDQAQRNAIRDALQGGLVTAWQQRAYEDADVRKTVAALQAVPHTQLLALIDIAGFTLQPYVAEDAPDIEQSCATCMYYESHRRWCNLPELRLGVEPEWSCILWRI